MIGPAVTLADFERIVAAARTMVIAHDYREHVPDKMTLSEREAYEELLRRIGEAVERRAA